jgi:hypothetical protein
MKCRFFSTILILAASAGACSPSFEADLPDVEVTQRDLKIPAALSPVAAADVSVRAAFTLSSSDTAQAKYVNSNVLVHAMRITPTDSQTRLDCIHSASLTVAVDGRQETTIPVAKYDRDPNATPSSDIEVSMPAPVDVTAVWSADKTVVELQVTGQLPTQDWTVDLTLNLSGKITYKY